MTSYMAFAASVTESNGCGECYCAHTVMGSGMTSYMAFAASVTEKNKHQDEWHKNFSAKQQWFWQDFA